jgi:dTDP-4-dehydrorhamnose reductase
MSRWLVTGATGLLGSDLVPQLRSAGDDVVALDRTDLDVTSARAVLDVVVAARPDVVVNCAAWTAVDSAEAHEDEALAVNGGGPAPLAAACRTLAADGHRGGDGPLFLQLSTDYVFAGDAGVAYAEDAATGPRSAYGRTKLAGERAVRSALPRTGHVLRTAWLYGAHGPNFVATMLRLEREQRNVSVVDDQTGAPTWTCDVADRIVRLGRLGLAREAPPGVYHATSGGATTWCGLARAVFELVGADPERVLAITTAEMPRPALRPVSSVLGHGRWSGIGVAPIGDWRERLTAAMPSFATWVGRSGTSR